MLLDFKIYLRKPYIYSNDNWSNYENQLGN